jgi:hypothetical protein
MAQQGSQVPAVVQAVAPRVLVWARTPGTHNANNMLDFDNTKDVKYYFKAIEWIADKYNLMQNKLYGYGQ